MKNVEKKQAMDYIVIATIFHESSHTIVALHNYIKAYNVNTITETEKDGNTEYYDITLIKDSRFNRKLLIFELQMLYAGLVGEKMYYKSICGSDKFPMHLKVGSSNDIQNISKIIRKHKLSEPGKNTVAFKKQLQHDVGKILFEYWSDVQLVAHALYKKKYLSYDDIKYVLTRKSVNKEFWKDRFKKINIIHKENNEPSDEEIKNIILN